VGDDASPATLESATARLRLLVALSALPGGERRLSPRWPLAKAGGLRLASRDAAVTLLDLGRGGALLAPIEGLAAHQALDAELVLGDDPALAATIATDADRLVHLVFAPGATAHAAMLADEMLDWAAHYEAGLWQATALANEVERLFEIAIAEDTVAPDDLFMAGLRFPGGRTSALGSRLLALMAQALPPSDELAYIAATDRNGFTTSVAGEHSGNGQGPDEQGPDERKPSENAAMDAVTLRAARFSDRALVQTYRRRPGQEPLGVIADLSAPVVVRGRRWGCVRIGRALPKAARV
jgi:methyl-accepting chemotaxis protein